MPKRFGVILVVIAIVSVIGILLLNKEGTQRPWMLADVTGHLPDLHFSLAADNGQSVTEKSYRGQIVVLYFGFTQCPDLCPLTLARMDSVFHALGSDANHVHLLFISLDPLHDSPKALHAYLKSFDAQHMTGLTGNAAMIEELTKRYHAAFQAAAPNAAIMHTDSLYIFDATGHARLLATGDNKDEAIASDIRRLLNSPQ